jgi:hypothetical protein
MLCMSVRHQHSRVDAQRQVTFNGRTVEVERHAHCFLCLQRPASVIHIDARQRLTSHSPDVASSMAMSDKQSVRTFHSRFLPIQFFSHSPRKFVSYEMYPSFIKEVALSHRSPRVGCYLCIVNSNTRITCFNLLQGSATKRFCTPLVKVGTRETCQSNCKLQLPELQCSISAMEGSFW